MHDITIDFGGTNIKIAIMENGRLVCSNRIPARSDAGIIPRLGAVECTVRKLLAECGVPACSGVGIAMPGIVDPERKRVLSINGKFADAVDFDFTEWVGTTFGLPLVMENDAKAALLGEVAYGAAVGETDVVLVIFGTGIGTAALMHGSLLHGRHYQAGNLGGHLTTNIEGRMCTCGNVGCAEAQSSHWAIREIARERPGFSQSVLSRCDTVDYHAVIDASVVGDAFASTMLAELIRHWSAVIVNMIHAYDPELVVLSGGLMKSAQRIVPRIEETVHRHAWTPWGKVRFAVAAEPDMSVLLGLSALLHEQ